MRIRILIAALCGVALCSGCAVIRPTSPDPVAMPESADKGSAHRADKKHTKWFEKLELSLVNVRVNSPDQNEYGSEVGEEYTKTDSLKNDRGAGGGLGGSGVGDQSPGSSSDAGLNVAATASGTVANPFRAQDSAATQSVDNSVVQQRLDAMQAQVDGLARTAAAGTIPTNPIVPATTNGATPLAGYVWAYGGFDGSRAIVDPGVVLSNGSVDANGISYAVTDYSHWPMGSDGNALAVMFTQEADGTWKGGKTDWAPYGRTSRDFNNVRAGYGGWVEPASGTPFRFGLVSVDGRLCSNLIEDIWP